MNKNDEKFLESIMVQRDVDLLESNGWRVECHSPLEVRHEDGSFATGRAAQIVLEYLEYAEER